MDIFDLMELRFPEKHGTIIRYRSASAKLEADSVKMTVAIPVAWWISAASATSAWKARSTR